MSDDTSKHLHNVVPIDEQELQGHLNKVVLKTVEDTRKQMETSNNADSGWILTRAPVVVTRIAGVKVKVGGI